MAESEDEDQQDEDSETADDAGDGERLNDPLTRADVKAPRVPFGSRPSPEKP